MKTNHSKYDHMSAYQYAFKQNPDMNGLPIIPSNATITIDFGEYSPDKFSVSYEYLTVGNKINSQMGLHEVISQSIKGKKFSFSFSPTETSLLSDVIVGRVYMLTVSWGDNECEYAFMTSDTLDFMDLYSVKTPFVGDNSKVVQIVDGIDLSKTML